MRQLSGLVVCLVLLLVSSMPSPALQSEYQSLRNQIRTNQPLDTGLVNNLPSPASAEGYWLRSFTRTVHSKALSDVREAIDRANGPISRYLRTWLDLVLLDDPAGERLRFLRDLLKDNDGRMKPGLWLQAGKYAGSLERYRLAERWARRALEGDTVRHEARLDLAEYALARGKLGRAEQYLEDYLLNRPGRTDPRYWLLRGRYFQEQKADSEAYVAYSHLVRNYPGSLVLERAESKLHQLPLPSAFRPETSGQSYGRGSATAGSDRSNPNRSFSESAGRWVIQLGSFRNRSRARRYKRRMDSRLEGVLMIQSTVLDGVRYYRVQLGGFETKQQAQRRQRQLERDGINSFIMEGSHQ